MKFRQSLTAVAVASLIASNAWATNGMNLEGYGPMATAMGGASFAYDNGTAAVMNNPATLGLMKEGSRLDVALGFLGPDVTSTAGGIPADSDGTAYWMPALGYIRKSGSFTYGIGVYAQGGMGTDYSATSPLALGSGKEVRSEVSVGRASFPLAYNVNDRLIIAGTLDFMWGGMDLRMAVPTAQLGAMVTSASAAWGAALPGLGGMNWGRFDFSNGSDFTGEASNYGYAGKLGIHYQVNDAIAIGLTYHSKSKLGDFESGNATLSAGMTGGPALATFSGDIKVRDFQWPETYGIGIAFKPNDRWLVAMDYKRINWSGVMKDFKMTFSTAAMGDLDVAMPQNWDDQNVFSLGAAYQVTPAWALRAGYNYAKNPVPDSTVNPLFPAIIERHYTAGLGYDISDHQQLDFSLTYAPEVDVTNTTDGTRITHSQLNWQLMYSHNF